MFFATNSSKYDNQIGRTYDVVDKLANKSSFATGVHVKDSNHQDDQLDLLGTLNISGDHSSCSEKEVLVNNNISSDGFIRYMAGSFSDYQGAIDYQAQMRARGFSDAFIVTFQDGNRIGLDIAIKDNNIKINQTKESNQPSDDFKFTVQIMVSEGLVSADDIVLMAKLGKIDKRATGSDMYEYYAGTYSSLEEANIQLERAKNIGFSDAFVFATNNGERVSLEYVKNFLKKEPSE